jgi:hypothetical protein
MKPKTAPDFIPFTQQLSSPVFPSLNPEFGLRIIEGYKPQSQRIKPNA